MWTQRAPSARLCLTPLMVGGITSVPFLEDRIHQGQLPLGEEDASLKCSTQKICKGTCEHMKLEDPAILVMDIPVSIA